jgi:hypothetical protein
MGGAMAGERLWPAGEKGAEVQKVAERGVFSMIYGMGNEDPNVIVVKVSCLTLLKLLYSAPFFWNKERWLARF